MVFAIDNEISIDDNQLNREARKISRKRNKRRWKEGIQASNSTVPPQISKSQAEIRLEMYQKLTLRQKIRFASQGYKFDENSVKPAIKIFTTCLKAVGGMQRGVQATDLLPYLPEGFVIFYSWHEITTEPITTGIQQYYQIELGNLFYQIDPDPVAPYGLANFVNAALQANSVNEQRYKDALAKHTRQRMHITNCSMAVTNSRNGALFRKRYPVYLKVIKPVRPYEELLDLPNYGGDHIYPINDIAREVIMSVRAAI